METNQYKRLGIPTTIGELKNMIKDYPDDTPFGFLGQPLQELKLLTFGGCRYVNFTEIPSDYEKSVERIGAMIASAKFT